MVVVPDWLTQYWHSHLLRMAMKEPFYFSSSRHTYDVDTHIACQKSQTDGSKGNFAADMVLKRSFLESTNNKYVGYIKQWMVYATDN